MTAKTNKQLVREYYETVVSTGNFENIEKYVSADYYQGIRPDGKVVGIEGAKQHMIDVRKTYPDLHLTVEQQIAEGDWVVTRVTGRGTHKGEWLDMKPTGKKIEMTAVNIDKVVDGRIVEHGGAANVFEELLRIEAIKVVSE